LPIAFSSRTNSLVRLPLALPLPSHREFAAARAVLTREVQRVIDALLDQTKSIERAVAALDLKSIEFEGSDSLDNPQKVEEEQKAEGAAGAQTR